MPQTVTDERFPKSHQISSWSHKASISARAAGLGRVRLQVCQLLLTPAAVAQSPPTAKTTRHRVLEIKHSALFRLSELLKLLFMFVVRVKHTSLRFSLLLTMMLWVLAPSLFNESILNWTLLSTVG